MMLVTYLDMICLFSEEKICFGCLTEQRVFIGYLLGFGKQYLSRMLKLIYNINLNFLTLNMRSALTILAVSSVIALTNAQSWPSAAPAPGQSVRISGSQDPATKSGDLWKSGRFATEAPLPDGYNAPTPEGAIELKTYPTVRRAEVDSNNIFMSWAFG